MDESPLLAAVCDDDDESCFFSRNMQIVQNNNVLMRILNCKRVRNDRPFSGNQYIHDILDGHPDRCYDLFRLNKTKFDILCQEIEDKGIVKTQEVTIEEQVGMFLQIVGQASSMRKTADDFQHSLETVHRVFGDVLHSILDMQNDYLRQPSANVPVHPSVGEGTIYFPFKGALGAIDGTHIPAIVSKDKMDVHRNRKNFISQNVLGAVDFDMKFLYVSAGWEGSTQDMKVLRAALETGGFRVPSGRMSFKRTRINYLMRVRMKVRMRNPKVLMMKNQMLMAQLGGICLEQHWLMLCGHRGKVKIGAETKILTSIFIIIIVLNEICYSLLFPDL